jgi:transcriptional regulator with XRE-family HTH domain
MTDLRKVLASNIKLYRKALGLSQSKLADKVDTATNYIGMIETEKQFPSPQMLEKIAKALQIDTLELFSLKPSPVDVSVEKLRKDILTDISLALEKIICTRLHEVKQKSR